MDCEDYASNVCFLIGSILYVWLAVWDIIDNNATDDDSDDERIGRGLDTISPYDLLSEVAAWCYVIDAGFQISKLICHHNKKGNIDEVSSNGTNNLQNDDDAMATSLVDHTSDTSSFDYATHHHSHGHIETVPNPKGCWETRRCVAGAMVGVTFGAGAVLELASSYVVDTNEPVSDILSMASCHIYLVNALLLTAPLFSSYQWKDLRRFSMKRLCRTDNLEYLGDLFFLIGSVIDVILSYWNLEFTDLNLVGYGYLLSAILWLIDAIFYIAADHIGFDDDSIDQNNANTENTSDLLCAECDDHCTEQLAIITENVCTEN
jgi:hypothetical protein